MLKRRLCEARIEWQIECAGPLLIADGRYTPPKSDNREDRGKYPDKVFVSHANAATIDRIVRRPPPAEELLNLGFYVPGTSLRGPFRAQAERMIRSLLPEDMPPPATACDPFEADDKPLRSCSHRFEAHPPSVPYAAACPACKLFGCTGTASRIRFTDANIVDPTPTGKVHSVYRDMIGIDRFSGGVSPRANMRFHALENTRFTTTVEVTNFELWHLGMLAYVFRDFAMGLVPIGFGKTKGFGLVQGAVQSIQLTYLAGQAQGRIQHLGSLASDGERQHYGLQQMAAPACALQQAPATGFGLYETWTVTDHDAFWGAVAPAFNALFIPPVEGGSA